MPKNITPEEFMKLTPEERMIVAISEYFRTEYEKQPESLKRGTIFITRDFVDAITKQLAVHHLAQHNLGQERKRKKAEDQKIKKKVNPYFHAKRYLEI